MKTYTEGSLRQELLTNNVEAFLAAIVANALFQKPVQERAIQFVQYAQPGKFVELVAIADPGESVVCGQMLAGVSSEMVFLEWSDALLRVFVCTRKLTEKETQDILGLLASRWNVFI